MTATAWCFGKPSARIMAIGSNLVDIEDFEAMEMALGNATANAVVH
jgi:hypothetical protein